MYGVFEELMRKTGVNTAAVARETGISPVVLSDWKRGRSTPKQDKLQKLADFFGVTVDYLMTGEAPAAGFDNVFALRTKKVPLLGEIACGEPVYAAESRGEYVLTEEGTDADFCLRAKGDSMSGARILDGDIVFVRAQDAVDNGEIAAVIIGDEATLKRVYYYPDQGKLVLNAENPRYAPLVYVGEELDQVRIIGRAVAFQSYLA